ncbi:MAG: outer membrane protein multidrug efflux system [Herminiimonas sp.]|nr:outer membrane protein multidrug efflux system [Herminiimonas sp.]
MKRVAGICVLAATLAACATGPDYSRPELDMPVAFRTQDTVQGEQSLADLGWWEMYRDQTLQRLLSTALEQNRDVRIAAARVAEARALAGVTELARLPQLDIAGSFDRGRVFQGSQFSTGNLSSLQAQAFFEVDLWRRLASLNEAARAVVLANDYARHSIAISLIAEVATDYFALLSLDQQFRITERAIANRERFLLLTQRKFRQGASSGLDVSRAEASLALARGNLPDLQRQIARFENQLRILLGENPAAIVRERRDLQDFPIPLAVPTGLPSSLLERRPDLRQAEYNLAGATASVSAARAALFPSISLTGTFGWESTELSGLFSGPNRVWSFGLSLLQPLINAQRNGYQVEATRGRQEQAILQYQNAVAQAFREVADALAARRSFREFLTAQEQQVNALRQASQRVLRRYETGFSSYFEVIDAENSLFSAELQMVQAYGNSLVSLVQLYRALGGGWRGE